MDFQSGGDVSARSSEIAGNAKALNLIRAQLVGLAAGWHYDNLVESLAPSFPTIFTPATNAIEEPIRKERPALTFPPGHP